MINIMRKPSPNLQRVQIGQYMDNNRSDGQFQYLRVVFNYNKISISKFYRAMEILNVKKHGRAVPSFLKKTYQMLEEPENDTIVKWTPTGVGFMVVNENEFSKTILPKYFKHNKYSSFVRQLNMYNFHKVRSNANENCFIHERFIRNDLKSIQNIKRKPERKKKKTENQSASCGDKSDSQLDDFQFQQSKILTQTKKNVLSYKYPNHKITIRIANKSFQNDQVLLEEPLDDYLKTVPSDSNTYNRKQIPVTGIELRDSDDDNISIQNGIQMLERSQLKIPTKFLINHEGSGIFPLHTGMISIYSMSSLIK